jgi:hypothetical protein
VVDEVWQQPRLIVASSGMLGLFVLDVDKKWLVLYRALTSSNAGVAFIVGKQ